MNSIYSTNDSRKTGARSYFYKISHQRSLINVSTKNVNLE